MTVSAPVPLKNAVLCQVGIVVKNADRTAKKLSEVTGLEIPTSVITDDYEKARTQFRGQPSPAKAKLIIFNMGQVAIEMIEPIGEPSTWSEFLESHGEGVHPIAFTLPDAARAAEGLSERGIPVVQSGVFEGGKYIYLDAQKDFGALLELLEFNSDRQVVS
jgi:methylmalonyl-CoA/ethylmalonyl-CoA epimerase